jgi:hypothetical protein
VELFHTLNIYLLVRSQEVAMELHVCVCWEWAAFKSLAIGLKICLFQGGYADN